MVNKAALAAAFGRAAKNYPQYAQLQLQSATKLLAMLPQRTYKKLLDAGCGPGKIGVDWRARGCAVTALDLSQAMLLQAQQRQAAEHYVRADIEALPFVNQYFDLVWSNLSLQWCANLAQALAELHRVTRPGGLVAFSTLLAGSLPELQKAWRAVDTHPHVNSFLNANTVLAAMSNWHYEYQLKPIRLDFPTALDAMRSLKGVGATHLHQGRNSSGLGRRPWQQLEQAWPQQQGKYPLTYQLFMGIIQCE